MIAGKNGTKIQAPVPKPGSAHKDKSKYTRRVKHANKNMD